MAAMDKKTMPAYHRSSTALGETQVVGSDRRAYQETEWPKGMEDGSLISSLYLRQVRDLSVDCARWIMVQLQLLGSSLYLRYRVVVQLVSVCVGGILLHEILH